MALAFPVKKKSTSILMSDLMGNIEFDSKQTVPAMDITSDKYNAGMSLYLQTLGVQDIDKEYNAAVKLFETQLEEQEIAARMDANLASEVQTNRAAEFQPGLGTGAAAVAAEGQQAALQTMQDTITKNIAETYEAGIQNIEESYQSELEAILGKYDPITGTFESLSEYTTMADKATEALMKTLAISLNSGADTLTDKYLDNLKAAGLVEKDVNGVVTLTEAGQNKIEQIVNGAAVNEPNQALGGRTFISVMAEQMAIADYTVDGVSSFDSLSETKKTEILREYQSWIHNNQDNLRISSWELYEFADGVLTVDRFWSAPDLSDITLYHEGVDIDSGIPIVGLSLEHIEADTESQDRLDSIKTDIQSGKIPDGSYITFASGKANDNDKFYYVYQGHVYETGYTMKNPPKQISVDSASVYSFGLYADVGVGKNTKQDKYTHKIIDYAKAGKIPDGMYIAFNYGSVSSDYGVYQYSNGKFIKADLDTKIDFGGNKNNTLGYWLNQSSFKDSASIIRVGAGNNFSQAAGDILGAKETFMGWGESLDW